MAQSDGAGKGRVQGLGAAPYSAAGTVGLPGKTPVQHPWGEPSAHMRVGRSPSPPPRVVLYQGCTTQKTGYRKPCKPLILNGCGGGDLNPRPLGYEPNELPDCSTPRHAYTKSI